MGLARKSLEEGAGRHITPEPRSDLFSNLHENNGKALPSSDGSEMRVQDICMSF